MSIKQTSAVLLACIISLIFHPIHATTTFNNGLWTPDAVASATPAPIAGIPNKVVATTAAPAQPLTTAAPAAPASVCTPYQCNLFYQVSAQYLQANGQNSDVPSGFLCTIGLKKVQTLSALLELHVQPDYHLQDLNRKPSH